MSDRDLMIHIMNSLPEQYDPVIDNLEIRLMKNEEDPDYLMLDSLREKLSDRYARIMDKEDSKSERDKGLSSSDQKFKGLCNICGKYGHKAKYCPEKKSNQEKGKGSGNRNNGEIQRNNCTYNHRRENENKSHPRQYNE